MPLPKSTSKHNKCQTMTLTSTHTLVPSRSKLLTVHKFIHYSICNLNHWAFSTVPVPFQQSRKPSGGHIIQLCSLPSVDILTTQEAAGWVLTSMALSLYNLFIFRERGKRKRNISVWLPFMCSPLRTWPITQACALTRNQTSDPLLCSPALNPLSHTSQVNLFLCISFFWCHYKWNCFLNFIFGLHADFQTNDCCAQHREGCSGQSDGCVMRMNETKYGV